MKIYQYILLFTTALFIACADDNDPNPQPQDETHDLILTKTLSNATHQIAIYTQTGIFHDGYNKVYLQLKDNNGSFINNADLSWEPMMHMENMHHGGPHSQISRVSGKQTLYEGWIVFQMPGNAMESWYIDFNYEVEGQNYGMESPIDVQPSPKRVVSVFQGNDGVNYILAMIEPTAPKVAVNDMSAAIFKMGEMHDFPIVNSYQLKIDPRMPGMDNHGSPNNVDLTQGSDGFYHGKLSLTMTGYWKINLMLQNQNGEILKGEPVTDDNESSSIFFEIEF